MLVDLPETGLKAGKQQRGLSTDVSELEPEAQRGLRARGTVAGPTWGPV